jgi:hypothetical protein
MISLFVVIVFSFFSNVLYAFENEYFKVDDNGWEVKHIGGLQYVFTIKDYVPEFDDNIKMAIKEAPYFHVQVGKNDLSRSFNYDPYSREQMDSFRQIIEKYYYNTWIDRYKLSMQNELKGVMSRKDIQELINDLFRDCSLGNVYISKFGKYGKCLAIDYDIIGYKYTSYGLTFLHSGVIVTKESYKSIDFADYTEYKNFVSSFNVKDKEYTKMNVIKENILLIIIVTIVILVSIFIKIKKYMSSEY